MIDKQRLEAKCSTWNITLTGTQLDQLDAFAQISSFSFIRSRLFTILFLINYPIFLFQYFF